MPNQSVQPGRYHDRTRYEEAARAFLGRWDDLTPASYQVYSGRTTLRDDPDKRPIRVTVLKIDDSPIAYHCDRGFIRGCLGEHRPYESARFLNAILIALAKPQRINGVNSLRVDPAKATLTYGTPGKICKRIKLMDTLTLKTPRQRIPDIPIIT